MATWFNRIGARAGAQLNSRYAYTDPWGPNRLKQGSYNPEVAILWDGGLGYIYRSTDGGRNWTNITPTAPPPNSWGDTPAPTAADLTYEQGVADWHTNKRHYWIAWYQNAASEYRGYLLRTDNDGQSWTYYEMGSDHLSVATWGFGREVVAPSTDWLWCDTGGSGNPVRTSLITPENVLAQDGASGGVRVDYVNRADNTGLLTRGLLIDFGTYFQLNNATLDAGINVEARLTNVVDTMTKTVPADIDILVTWHKMQWTACNVDRIFITPLWDGGIVGYPPAVPSTQTGVASGTDWIRYCWLELAAAITARYRGTGFWQHLFDYVKAYPHAVQHEIRPISIDLDKETGRFLYITTWEGNHTRLRTYDTQNSLSFPVHVVRMGDTTTRNDIETRTKWLAVKSLYDAAMASYGEQFVLYGLFKPGVNWRHIYSGNVVSDRFYALNANPSDDGTWNQLEWLGALKWPSQNHFIVIMNRVAGTVHPELWETFDNGITWFFRSSIPFTSGVGRGVEFAMARHNGTKIDPTTNSPYNTIAVGDRNSEEIFQQSAPYNGAWTDLVCPGAGTRVGALHYVYNETP